MLKMAAFAGEPMQTGFDPKSLSSDLASEGLALEENLRPEDIHARYFHNRTDGYYACEHVHFAKATVL